MTHIHISKQQWLFSLFLLFFSYVSFSQKEGEVSFLFVGDVMQHGPQIEGAYNKVTGSYEYENSLNYIKPVIQSVDFAIANLEVTHAGKPYKGYPQFSAPDELSAALQSTGFDIILTSNNHSCDGGGKGVLRTLDVLDKLGILHTGTFRNKKERDANYPLIVNKNGIKVAFLNYTYGTNGLTVPSPIIINYIDSAVIKADMLKAKSQADYIICTMHWGDEYKSLPNAYQKHWEKYCYELGADMVIGGHPHVIQPIERKKVNGEEKLTAWSLGNFVSNQRDRYKNGGMYVVARIQRNLNTDGKAAKVELKDANYFLAYVHKREEGIFKPYYILPEYDYNSLYNDFILPKDLQLMNEFFADSRKLMAEHSKNVSELSLIDLGLEHYYEHQLKGYYSVMVVDKAQLGRLKNEQLMHKKLAHTGEEIWISGYCKSFAEAELNRQVLMKLGENRTLQIVRITPDGYKIMGE